MLPPPTRSFIHSQFSEKEGIMWTKQQAVAEPPAISPAPVSSSPVVPFNAPSASRLGSSAARSSARLGATIEIKGHITCSEALQIYGKVDRPLSLHRPELTAGSTAELP